MKKPLALLALALALGLAGCQPGTTTTSSGTDPDTSDTGGSSTVDVTDTTETDSTPEQTLTVEITSTVTTVEAGKTITLSANIVNGEEGDKVTWSSGNTAVATIDANTGVLTGVAAGTATITAACGEATDTVEITVTPAIPAELASGTSFHAYLQGQAEATVSSISYMKRELRPTSEKPETTRYVSKMTKDEILREYDNTGTWDEGKHSSYAAIIGSTYYEIDTYGSGRGSRRAILPGDSEAEFSEAVARQNLEMTQEEGDLHGILAEDEALAAWKADRNVEGALKELDYQVDVDGGNYIVTYEAAYEHQEEGYEWENCVHYQVTATLNSEKEIIDLTAEETRATINQWDFETHSPKADASSVYEYTYAVEDIVYVDELADADPDDLLLDPTAYFVSEVTEATLDMTMATGKDDDGNPVFQVGDRIWLDETTIEYLPATALDADSLQITGYYDSTTDDPVEGAAITDMYGGTTWAKPGTYDIAIGNAYDADMGRIEGVVVTGEAVSTSIPNITAIDTTSGVFTDVSADQNGDEYAVSVAKWAYAEATFMTDQPNASQSAFDQIEITYSKQGIAQAFFYVGDGMMLFQIMGMADGEVDITIHNSDPAAAYGIEKIVIHVTVGTGGSGEATAPTITGLWKYDAETLNMSELTGSMGEYNVTVSGAENYFIPFYDNVMETTPDEVALIDYELYPADETAITVSLEYISDIGLPIMTIDASAAQEGDTLTINIINPDGSAIIINVTVGQAGTVDPTPGGEETEAPIITNITDDGIGLTKVSDGEYNLPISKYYPTSIYLYKDEDVALTVDELNAVDYTVSDQTKVEVAPDSWEDLTYLNITATYAAAKGDVVDVTINNPDGSTIVIHCTVA